MADIRFRDRFARLSLVLPVLLIVCAAVLVGVSRPVSAQGGLIQVSGFGSNPGNLIMYSYRPAGLAPARPLVVALHGCTQSAADYFGHAGWEKYADLWRFALVLPEQKTGNNGNECFNWFEPGDTARGMGEALSIKQMVDYAIASYATDAGRVYVTGLSAGGAMTNVMLATYPEVFAGGAVIAGLAYRCATDLISALNCMNAPPNRTPAQWGALVRGAHPGYGGPYPRVSIWYGTSDTTVVPANADEQRDQWTDIWDVDPTPTASITLPGGTTLYEYADDTGTPAVRVYRVSGIAHGTPVDPGVGLNRCGTSARYYLDSICSAYHIAVSWGLPADAPPPDPEPTDPPPTDPPPTDPTVTTGPATTCVTADNYRHTVENRAYARAGVTYARGSNDDMGLWNTYIRHTLRQTGPDHWVLADGQC